MAFLDVIKAAARVCIDTEPSTAIGNTDAAVAALVRFAKIESEHLAQRYRWQKLVNESTFTSTAVESQGEVTTLTNSAFGWICNDTVWNRTSNRQMFPVDDVQWQRMKSSSITGPNEYFRIRGNEFIVIPTMSSGDTVAFEWVSKNYCEGASGTAKSTWDADTNVGLIDEEIVTLGTIWRWKKDMGRPDWAEDYKLYEQRVQNLMARDGAKKHINMSARRGVRFLSENSVKEGDWF